MAQLLFETEPYRDASGEVHKDIVRVTTEPPMPGEHPTFKEKLIPRDQVTQYGSRLRGIEARTVFTSGSFDMIHLGHIRYLELGRTWGEVLVVGLNSDASIRQYKGPDRPILRQELRAEVLAALGCVDHIVIFDEPRADALIRELKPDVFLCIEENYVGRLHEKPEVVAVREYGGLTVCAPRQAPELSTSAIIAKLEGDGRARLARQLQEVLGENSLVSGSL